MRFALERVSMEEFRERAEHAARVHAGHPKNLARQQRIIDLIADGERIWPLFLYGEDRFLLVGWHRVVALHLLGHTMVDVALAYRQLDHPDPDPAEFTMSETQIVRDGRVVVVRWRGTTIARARIGTTPYPDGGRSMDNSFVLPAFRRKGIAKRLYDAVEEILALEGLRLVPSPEPSLSDSAFGLWKSRAPHLLRSDTRNAVQTLHPDTPGP